LVGPDNVDAAHASAELSFLVHERFWGQGYAADPYFSFQRFSFCLLQPSTAAVQEGLLREFARKGDAFHDVVMVALLRKEWPPVQKLDQPFASIATQKALS
jgi:hypothetical protein